MTIMRLRGEGAYVWTLSDSQKALLHRLAREGTISEEERQQILDMLSQPVEKQAAPEKGAEEKKGAGGA